MTKLLVECETADYMMQLAREHVPSYSCADKEVSDVVDDLLAFQKNTPAVTAGDIIVSGEVTLSITEQTVLSALRTLRDIVGGYMEVDNDRELNWLVTIGEDNGQQIRYRKNLLGISKETDYMAMSTLLSYRGSAVVLSDNSFVKTPIDKDADATYGYLTLKEKHGAYNDFSGVGNALPGHIGVYRIAIPGDKSYSNPTTAAESDGTREPWTDIAKTYNGATGDYGYVILTYPGASFHSYYLTFDRGSNETIDGCRIYISGLDGNNDWTQLKAWLDGDLVYDQFDPDVGGWLDIPIAGSPVGRYIKIEVSYFKAGTRQFRVHDFDFYEYTGETDDTALFVQGADERTLRCAIGDYEAGDEYLVSYEHADYLVHWTAIATYGTLYSIESNVRITNAADLLSAGRLALESLATPLIRYSISTTDLSMLGGFDFEQLELGSTIKVIDEDLGIDVEVIVLSINHPDFLANPMQMMVELATVTPDIADTLVGFYDQFERI